MSQQYPEFDDQFSYDEENSNSTGRIPDSILEAIRLVKALHLREDSYKLYLKLSKKLNPEISEDAVKTIVHQVLERGYDIRFEVMQGAIMKCEPVHRILGSDIKRPIVYFNSIYALLRAKDDQAHRQTYLHIIKLFHEFTHTIVPFIMATHFSPNSTSVCDLSCSSRTIPNPEQLQTPEKIGSTLKSVDIANNILHIKGDSGSEWEELECGGRVIPALSTNKANNAGFPYRAKLQLIRRKFTSLPPCDNNLILYRIHDEYIKTFLITLRSLASSNTAIPDDLFQISDDQLELAKADLAENDENIKLLLLRQVMQSM